MKRSANDANHETAWSKKHLKSTPVDYHGCSAADYKNGFKPAIGGQGLSPRAPSRDGGTGGRKTSARG